jgi:hypothetical protein
MFDEHIEKILAVRGVDRESIVDWDELRQVYLRQYHTTKHETGSADAAYVDASEAVIAYVNNQAIKTTPKTRK